MDSVKSRPVSSQTFGPSERFLQAPAPTRSVSMRRSASPDVETRPTLIRSQTPNHAEDQQEISKMFSANMFADPAPQKAYGKFGPKLFTDGHERLIYMLREECGRLFSFNKTLKNKLATAERTVRQQNETLADCRSALHGKSEKLASITAELREAHDVIREMDEDLERTRSKRLSRINPHLDIPSLGHSVEYAS